MESNSWLYKILSLEKGEGKMVVLPTIYSFFTGVSLAYFVTSSTSLFLNNFEKDMLSVAFIASGVIVWLIGIAFSQIQKRIEFSKSLTIGIGFLLISILVFVALFISYKSVVINFIIYAWIRVFAYMHAVTFWGMAGRIFSLRQGKRLFGLISGGEVIASIIAFFSVPFLLKVISTEDLLIISGITLFIGFFILLLITRKFSTALAAGVKKKIDSAQKSKIKKTSFFQNRYYKLFFIIAFAPIFVQFFVDYIFQAQAKIEYPGKEELTAFVGIFFGFSSIVEFFLKTFISGKLMSRYGMRLGLMAFPGVMVISLILATLFGFIFGAVSLFFSFIVLARLFTRAVRTSFNDPATQLLYQPLPPDERISFQNKVESGPKAYASIVAGILLLIFAKIPGINLVYFALFLLVITILWTFSAKEIYLEYRNTLQNILSGKKTIDLNHYAHPFIQKISHFIKSGNLKDAKSVARLSSIVVPFETDKIYKEYPELAGYICIDEKVKFSNVIELSKSENIDERIFALRQMPNYSIYKVEKPLVRLLHDDDFEVKCEAIIAAAKMKETELFNHLVTIFQNPEFKTIASKAMINIGAPILPELDQNFQKTEYDVDIQINTIELVERFEGEKVIEFLKRNINHHIKSVSDRAIQALGKLKYIANAKESQLVWQRIDNEIKNYVFITAALYYLKETIDSPILFKLLEHEKKEKKNKIFDALSVLYDNFAIMLIAESLESSDKNARGFAIEVADMIISDLHKPLLFPLIECDSEAELLQKYMLYFPTGKNDVIEQLTDIINSEYWVIGLFAKATALKILASYNDKRVMPILMSNIVHPRPMMWQLAAFCIYRIDNTIFETEIYQNFPKVPGLKWFAANIQSYDNGVKLLIYERLLQLKNSILLEDIPEDELIEIATKLKKFDLEPESKVLFERKSRQYIIILDGSLAQAPEGRIYKQGDIFCPWLQYENEQIEYFADIQKTTYISIDMHMVNSLVAKNKGFLLKLMEQLWKQGETNIKTESELIANGIKNDC